MTQHQTTPLHDAIAIVILLGVLTAYLFLLTMWLIVLPVIGFLWLFGIL